MLRAKLRRRVFEAIRQRWGTLNSLVNAAGPGGTRTMFDGISDDEWHRAYDLGAMSAVRCTRAALPLLRAAEWARS
jgi:3-oxoacyl-[acyl-carrier protein] reductase